MNKVMIANRGEIAIRILRAAADLGITTVGVYSEDDASSLHLKHADEQLQLNGKGARAYLDMEDIVALAKVSGCDAMHPGYGFLSENADFARLCFDKGIEFIGPTPEQLALFGDKGSARSLAKECGVPLTPGTNDDTSLEQAQSFMADLEPGANLVIKAVSGGGGRGMRQVRSPDELEKAYTRCRSEAAMAFGNDAVYVEQYLPRVRHVEVQIIGDGKGAVSHLWDRECTLQRQHQKLVEIAPSPSLSDEVRKTLIAAAMAMAEELNYQSLGTFEFLVDADRPDNFYFIEANPRLQVEHTVTEEVTGVDIVRNQFLVAQGVSLHELALTADHVPSPRGYAIQCRINMEVLTNEGKFKPTGGLISVFEPPGGPGIRVDSYAYAGYRTSSQFDSLLAKLTVHTPAANFAEAVNKTYRALSAFRLEGLETNIPFLQNLLQLSDVVNNNVYTTFVDDNLESLAASVEHRPLYFSDDSRVTSGDQAGRDASPESTNSRTGLAGTRLDSNDPLAVLAHGKSSTVAATDDEPEFAEDVEGPADTTPVRSPLQGTIVELFVSVGEEVFTGKSLLVMEAMKMEHVVTASVSGIIREVAVEPGDSVFEDHRLVFIEEKEVDIEAVEQRDEIDLDYVRPDLQEAIDRHQYGLDESRPEAVERRRKTEHRTARENIEDLCDPDTFVEYGGLAIAAQRRRRDFDDLLRNTPGDGMVTGIGSVNQHLFPNRDTQCVLMSYDYTVLAGTQGQQNHRKKDRMFELAADLKLPVVLFAEGGGGRPGDTDSSVIAGLDCFAFQLYGHLSGLVPRIGITTGRCFAGNAALLGASDVVIATRGSNIGMGGPAMIEGGGLGVFKPEDVGPMDVQVPNGVVDVAVEDEAEAVKSAKQYLSYFQGPITDWSCPDQRKLRSIIPENRLRFYDIRQVIDTLADEGSVLELRPQFGVGMITAFIRIEGRPMGVIANNPAYLSGAIDSNGADKAARFMQLCDAFDIPILSLCDTPGIMVGPEIEKTALVRHAARMFVVGSSITVPLFTIVLRKGYGLGAQAMAGGGFKAAVFTVTWPTGEFGGMGLEGAVKLGYRKELEAIEDPEERRKVYEKRVQSMYEHGKAVNFATAFEIDDVIDPADSRKWIMAGLKATPDPAPRAGKKRSCVDTW